MAATRIYCVRRKDGTGAPRMVEAAHRDTALRHVAQDSLSVEVVSAVDAIALMQTGVGVEKARHEQQELSPTT